MAGRGVITEKIKKISVAFLGREITIQELRLYPYIQYTLMNGKMIDRQKVNSGEHAVIGTLESEGHLRFVNSQLHITEEFWNYMNKVLFQAYVEYETL